jgi:hypothetical protein
MIVDTITTWAQVYEALYDDTYNSRIERYRSRYAFRGLSSDYPLQTSLMRMGGQYAKIEMHLLRQFKKYAYQHLTDKQNEWFWVSVGQHYGLPTRLLDWTYSPEVALHFATSNTDRYDRDGVIWKVNYKKVHQLLPPALKGFIEEQNTWILTSDMLAAKLQDISALDAEGRAKGDFVVFFEPPSIDQRIFNQFAYFSAASRSNLVLDDWLAAHPDTWHKIIIPKGLKWEIRDKLDQNNVSERILFPGLGGLADWLKRYYLPTGSAMTP